MTQVADVPMLECRNVSKAFGVGQGLFAARKLLRAVDDVSLSASRGEVLAIVGESGCGKTTLAKMMLGLVSPTSGEILIKGTATSTLGMRDIAKTVQPVFQDPYSSLNPRKTVGAIISVPLKVHGVRSAGERHNRIAEIMRLVELPQRLVHSYPSQLSGGQRQRVAIARALVNRPEIVVCDEPTSALDVSVQASVLNLLQDLRRELNLTYVFISHNLAVVEHFADRVAVMYLGRLVEYGKTAELFRSPRHPYTGTLMESVLAPDPSRRLPEIALDVGFPDPLAPPPGCHFHPRCQKKMALCELERPSCLAENGRQVECHLYGRPA